MEIPEEVQNKLKCTECNELLSCGPVYLLHDTGGALCGRCSQQEQPETNDRTRNEPYEATASLLSFPCVFASRGCPAHVAFSLGQSPHELTCKFRPFICPIEPRGSCDWTGPWPTLKEHCDECHPSNVLDNPCNPPRPVLFSSNQQSYLISAFNFLFLLQIKVCLASGKLYQCLRMYGDPDYLHKFSFKLETEGNNMKFSKMCSVLRPGISALEEPDIVYTTIRCLLGIFSASESKFTLRIQALFKFCANCFREVDGDSESKFCGECAANLKSCKFHEKECLFVDVDQKKLSKHERFFCKQQTKCKCGEQFAPGLFAEHLESSSSCRKTSKSNIDAVFRLTPNIDCNKKMVLLSSKDFGTVICEYKLFEDKLVLRLYSPLPSHELKDFKCSIKLIDPLTKSAFVLTPDTFDNDSYWDWYVTEEMCHFESWKKHGTEIKINIVKK